MGSRVRVKVRMKVKMGEGEYRVIVGGKGE